ncbi:MAG: hypothetical protein WBF06_12090 [Candidatus Acidiferrales bacterium]
MTNEPDLTEVKSIWQNQPVEDRTMPLGEVRRRVERLESTASKFYWVGWLTVVGVTAIFVRYLFRAANLPERVGSALFIVGAGLFACQLFLFRKEPNGSVAGGAEPLASVRFYRSLLQRQRDFHSGLWFWSKLIITSTGACLYLSGLVPAAPGGIARWGWLYVVLVVALGYGLVSNLREARKYQREIDALDAING